VNARELLEDYAADGIDGYGLREHAAPEAFAALRVVLDLADDLAEEAQQFRAGGPGASFNAAERVSMDAADRIHEVVAKALRGESQ